MALTISNATTSKYRKKTLVYTAMQVEGTKIFRTCFVRDNRSCNEMVIYVLYIFGYLVHLGMIFTQE